MTDPNENLDPDKSRLLAGQEQSNLDPSKYTPLAVEEAAMKSGRWRMIVAMIVAVAAVVGGFIWFVAGDEKVAAASNYGRALNGAHQEHVEAFWSCALSGEQIKDLRTESELAAQLNGRAAGGRDRYATQLRERCAPSLALLDPKLASLIPPESLTIAHRDYRTKVEEFRSAISEFGGYITGLEAPYDEAAAAPRVHRIALTWHELRKSYKGLNDSLKKLVAK